MYRGLIVFGRQQEVTAAFQHDVARGLGLGMQGVQRDKAALQIQFRKELLSDRDFIGLGVHEGTAQVVLTGDTDSRQYALATAMFGLFAIQGDQFVFGRGTAELFLNRQENLLQLSPAHLLEQTPKRRLAGSRVAPPLLADPERSALRLAQFARKFGQVL